ncbi:MAG: hypothetical protein M3457_09580 [Chloroflexota bacterium]|nr:hypothetical protein [Chloroflexota bacterium]
MDQSAPTGSWHEVHSADPAASRIVYTNMPPFGMAEATRFATPPDMPPQSIRTTLTQDITS